MASKVTREKAVGGFFWTLAEKFGAQGVSFIVSIILARLLTPDDYGIVAIVTIFTSIANVFVKSGMGSALIQKKDADDVDFSTVFYFNIASSILLYGVIFVGAPFVSRYYKNPALTAVLRICALSLILNGINNVQQAYVSKHLDFKKFFFSTSIGTVVSAVVGILMAYKGFGVWALVAQQLLNSLMDTVFLQLTIAWSPTLQFSFVRLKKMYRFGYKLLISDLSSSIYSNLQALVIGKRYSSADLAFYNKGSTFPHILARNLDNSVQSVTFSMLASEQDDHERFRHLMFRACTMSYFFIFPMLIGMFAVAKPLVLTLLSDKWLPCVPYMQLYCLVYSLRPLEATNLQAIYALGRSDITLKLDIIKKVYGIAALVVAVFLFDSVIAIGIALVICTVLNTLLNMIVISRLVHYSVLQQLRSVSGITLASLLMGVACFGLGFLLGNTLPAVVCLLIQTAAGIAVYLLFCVVFRLQAFRYAVNYIKIFLQKHKKAPQE